VKNLIVLMFLLMAFISPKCVLGKLTLKPPIQGVTWISNTAGNVPFSIALNVVIRKSPPSTRLVYIYIEPQNCIEENLRKIFFNLSESYQQPANLIITARSDKASLQNRITDHLSFLSMRADGSFENRKRTLMHLPEEKEKGFYRAEYFRSEMSEHYSFSPDQNKQDLLSVTLKRTVGVGAKREMIFYPSGDKALDLVMASQLGQESEIKKLLDDGANINGITKYGTTPLLAALQSHRSQIVYLLLERGADVNQKDPDGWSPLMYALSWKGNVEIVEELLRREAEVNSRAANGDTALTIAVAKSQGEIKIVEQLLHKGADVTVRDRYGRTPLMIAEEGDHQDYLCEMLKKAMTRK
jgi:hypothetical protein